MKKSTLSYLLFIFILITCDTSNEIIKYSEFIYNYPGIKTINLNEVDSYNELCQSNDFCQNCTYGINFDLDKLQVTNDSNKNTTIIPLIIVRQRDIPVCRNYPAITIYLKNDSILIKKGNSFQINKLLAFEKEIDTYCMRTFTRKEFSFESRWNNIIINKDSSFKKYLFPVLTSMLKSYLTYCINNEKNASFSKDAKAKIKDFIFEIDSTDLNNPPISPNRQ